MDWCGTSGWERRWQFASLSFLTKWKFPIFTQRERWFLCAQHLFGRECHTIALMTQSKMFKFNPQQGDSLLCTDACFRTQTGQYHSAHSCNLLSDTREYAKMPASILGNSSRPFESGMLLREEVLPKRWTVFLCFRLTLATPALEHRFHCRVFYPVADCQLRSGMMEWEHK